MAIYHDIQKGENTGGVVNVPTGDVFCAFTFDLTGAPSSEWEQLAAVTANGFPCRLWSKARTSEGAQVTFTGGTAFPIVHLIGMSGVRSRPVFSSNSATSTTVTGLSVKAPNAGILLFGAIAVSQVMTGTPPGMTQIADTLTDQQTWLGRISKRDTGERVLTCASTGWGAFMAVFAPTGPRRRRR